jgi:hypothetical protein|uniref:Uncharacterized protein n=1 Tax=viral metagenome TaxID=1070528 RepID=A0A6C0INU4_9ZZZZ
MADVDTGTRPPSFFTDKLSSMQVRFNLVKKNFLESYDDYKKNIDGTNKNRRSLAQWEDLKMDLHTLKVSLKGKSQEFNDIIGNASESIDTRRKIFLDKDKQLEYKNRVIKSASPMKNIEYNKNTKVVLESLYYTTALIMMVSFMYKQYNQ